MFACREWFDGYGVTYMGADVVAMAALVSKRERDIRDAEKRGRWQKAHGMEKPR